MAWVLRQSLIGEQLGTALIGLLQTLNDFRDGEDNFSDLLDYMDEEGYLDIACEPTHALALLRLAEHFHIDDLYLRALAHCVGMSERLNSCPDYQVCKL